MKYLSTIMVAGMAGAFAVAAFGPTTLAQNAEAAWKMRSDAMKAQFQAFSRISKGEDAKAIADDARALQASLQKVPSLFAPGMDHPDDRAKAEAFTNQADIKAKADATIKAVGVALSAAEKGDVAAAKGASKGIIDSCNACHDVYRGPAKGK